MFNDCSIAYYFPLRECCCLKVANFEKTTAGTIIRFDRWKLYEVRFIDWSEYHHKLIGVYDTSEEAIAVARERVAELPF